MKNEKTKEIKYFSMFTGVGGFELGLENSRSESYLSSKWKKNSRSPQSLQTGRNQSSDKTTPSDNISFSQKGESKKGGNRHIGKSGTLLHSRSITTFRCVGFSETDKYANQLLKEKFPKIKNYGDATKIDASELPDFDFLVGGFPCQAFSIAGKRRGFEDTRGTLFHEIARISKIKKPKYLLLENVKGLLSHDGGRTFAVILATLSKLGYIIQWMVLNSKFFGVPQNRERVFIIGNLREEPTPEILPFQESNQNSHQPDKEKEFFSNTLQSRYHKGGGGTHINMINKMQLDISGKGYKSQQDRIYFPNGIMAALPNSHPENKMNIAVPVLTPERQNKRQHGRRFKTNGEPSFTITGQDVHGISDGTKIRRLTPLECERLQGFPDNWTKGFSDTQRYKMMGNAVTVNVIKAIVKNFI